MTSIKDVKRASHTIARFIWEEYWRQSIPEDWHVHHIDGNWANNEITNLVALSLDSHWDNHRRKKDAENISFLLDNADRILGAVKKQVSRNGYAYFA